MRNSKVTTHVSPETNKSTFPSAAPVGWQPIETAPKDGSWILLNSKWRPAVLGRMSGDPDYQCDFINTAFAENGPDRILDACNGFTHWMPLPDPPPDPAVDAPPFDSDEVAG